MTSETTTEMRSMQSKGGRNSRANMTRERASKLAQKAAEARWAAYRKRKHQGKHGKQEG